MTGLILSDGKGRRESRVLMINVSNEPYQRAEPDEYRLEPYGSIACDWTRNDG